MSSSSSAAFGHTPGSEQQRPTSVVTAEPSSSQNAASASSSQSSSSSSTASNRPRTCAAHFLGQASSGTSGSGSTGLHNPLPPPRPSALFDFDSDSTASPSVHPASASVTPITNSAASAASGRPTPAGDGGVAVPAAGSNPMDLVSLFECPVCMDFALPPILQCQSGHIVCATCRAKLSSCPTCRGNLENIRNLAMEKLAASVLFPCKYAMTGCTETFHYTVKADHEAICEHRPYSCPCPGASCKWLGQLDQVMNHLLQSHKSITTLQGEDIVFLATDITLPGAVDWVMMQSCFGHYFMLVLEKQERYPPDQLFFALVLLIGTKKQADQFVYRLELTASTRRLTWEATPHSIHDGVQAAIGVSDCLVFDSNTAQLFADNGSLGINVAISRVRGGGGGGGGGVPSSTGAVTASW